MFWSTVITRGVRVWEAWSSLRKKCSAASALRAGLNLKSNVAPVESLPKPGCHHPDSAPKPCMRVGPSQSSSGHPGSVPFSVRK
jgi:hypothetical protein